MRLVAPWPLALVWLIRDARPDVVQLHGPAAGSVGAVAARLAGGRSRVVYVDHAPHRDRRALARAARRLTSAFPEMNVAVSNEVATSLVRDAGIDPGRVAVIVSGTPVVDAAVPGPEPVFGYLASLQRIKGYDVLLRALARLGDVPSVRLRAVGEGVERARIVALARDLGVAERVELLGYRPDPWEALRGIAAYVHAARAEGGPLAVMEAMMRGYPVVTTAVGAVPEIVADGETGLVVPPRDDAALAVAMRRLATDAALRGRLGRAARAFALERLAIDRCVADYFRVYERLLA